MSMLVPTDLVPGLIVSCLVSEYVPVYDQNLISYNEIQKQQLTLTFTNTW